MATLEAVLCMAGDTLVAPEHFDRDARYTYVGLCPGMLVRHRE